MKTTQSETINFDGKTLLIAVEPDKKFFIEKILDKETDIKISETKWQSKYNAYVEYDYEPFSESGFIVNYFVIGNPNKLEFLKVIIEQSLNQRALLERCLEKTLA